MLLEQERLLLEKKRRARKPACAYIQHIKLEFEEELKLKNTM